MKRKSLEQIEPVGLSFKKAKADFLVEAQTFKMKESEVLELDIYNKAKQLMCRHFVCETLNYYSTVFMKDEEFEYSKKHKKGDWYQGKYETILNKGNYYYGYIENKAAYSDKAMKIIKKYCNSGNYNMSCSYMIQRIEDSISREKQNEAYERKCNRIDEMMSNVKPLDEDFYNWIKESVFTSRYIFAECRPIKRGYRCRCATCGKTFLQKEKPKHNDTLICKKCGVNEIVKTRVQNVTERKSILVAQKYSDTTYVLRHFRAVVYHAHFMKETKMTIHLYERIRMFLAEGKNTRIYYGTEQRADEFEQDWWTTKGGIVIDKKFLFYPRRLEETQMNQSLKATLLKGAMSAKEMDYNQLIRCWEFQPYIEYLIKGRFYKLANEIISIYGYWTRPDAVLDINAKSLSELLQVDSQRMHRLRSIDGGEKALELLQIEERDGIKITQDNLEFVNVNNIDVNNLEMHRTGLSINQTLNYFRRQMEKNKMPFSTIQQYYSDYLDMAEHRHMDLTDDIVRKNARMVEFHNQYVEEKAREENEKRMKEVNKKFSNIAKDYKKNCKAMAWENEEYVILVPKEAAEIIMEGRIQHHCVGASDTYMSRMHRGESYILFLRRKAKPEVPYYTLEVSGTTIKQKYAAYDRQPDIKQIDKVLSEWKKEIKKRQKDTSKKAVTEMVQGAMLQVAAG